MTWSVEFLDESVRALLAEFPLDIRASFERIVSLIQNYGLERVHEPYVKHLEGPVWEMRMKGRSGIARAAYVTAIGKRVVVVHVFGKKTEKTPRREIERLCEGQRRFCDAEVYPGGRVVCRVAQGS